MVPGEGHVQRAFRGNGAHGEEPLGYVFGGTATAFVRWSTLSGSYAPNQHRIPPESASIGLHPTRLFDAESPLMFIQLYTSGVSPTSFPTTVVTHRSRLHSFSRRITLLFVLDPSSHLYSLLSPCSSVPVHVPGHPMPSIPRRHPVYLFAHIPPSCIIFLGPATAVPYALHPSSHPLIRSSSIPSLFSDASPPVSIVYQKASRLRSERPDSRSHKPASLTIQLTTRHDTFRRIRLLDGCHHTSPPRRPPPFRIRDSPVASGFILRIRHASLAPPLPHSF